MPLFLKIYSLLPCNAVHLSLPLIQSALSLWDIMLPRQQWLTSDCYAIAPILTAIDFFWNPYRSNCLTAFAIFYKNLTAIPVMLGTDGAQMTRISAPIWSNISWDLKFSLHSSMATILNVIWNFGSSRFIVLTLSLPCTLIIQLH